MKAITKEYNRADQVGDALKRDLASLIQKEVRDPRIGMVSITSVDLSRDLSHAKVYVTLMQKKTETEIVEAITGLNNAAGFLRTKIAHSGRGRIMPKLRFYFDSSVERGCYLSALIDKAIAGETS